MDQFKQLFSRIHFWAIQYPSKWDIFVLCLGLSVVTFHPFYLYGKINLFEASLYLPGIDAILKGQIPYRDFMHLRGPLELYFPAWWMQMTHSSFKVLPTYFYLGSIVTMILCILIAKELIQTRVILYSMTLAFIARTFPRVSYSIGGGFRLAWGLAAVYCVLHYYKTRKDRWLICAGLFSAVGLMTSIEVGVYAFASIFLTLIVSSILRRRLWLCVSEGAKFLLGALIVILPVCLYLQIHHAFIPMLSDHIEVCLNMLKTFPQENPCPSSVLEVIWAMINPVHINFKHMTPMYCYLAAFVYLLQLKREGKLWERLFCFSMFAFLLFVGSMRGLWGPAFESALQPEKVLLFILLERTWFWLRKNDQKTKRIIAAGLITVIVFSSIGYSVRRYSRRFDFFRMMFAERGQLKSISPFSDTDLTALDVPRMEGMIVPNEQAQDINQLVRFMEKNSTRYDRIAFFPDLGIYHYIIDCPFIGRFPTITLSWIGSDWHDQYMRDLKRQKPRYVVTYKKYPEYYTRTQLVVPANQKKHDEFMDYVNQYYQIVSGTPTLYIWARKTSIRGS